MRYFIALLAFTLSLSANLLAQDHWAWQNPWPQGNTLRDIHVVNPNAAIAIGDLGTIIQTADGGIGWSSKCTTTLVLRAVHFIDANTGWAVGDDGTVLKTVDGGVTWSALNSGTTFYDWNAVYFVNADTGWVAGLSGQIRKTTDGGNTWSSQSNSTSTLYSVYFVDADTGWAVGASGVIIKTTNGGSLWSRQTSGTSSSLQSVHFVNPTTGWAVGAGGVIIKTANGGATWSLQNTGTTNSLYAVAFIDSTTGWAVGSGGIIIKTANGGIDWIPQSSGTTNALYSVQFADAHVGWVVGADGAISKTVDGGTTWLVQNRGTRNELESVYFINAHTGWAVGMSGAILKTINRGVLWSAQNSGTTNRLESVYFVDANLGWAVGDNGTIIRTLDGGSRWSLQSSPTTTNLNHVHFFDSDTGWVVGNGGAILKTTNRGATWFLQTSGTTSELRAVHCIDANTIWAVGDGGVILKTIDGGRTWATQISGTTNNLEAVYAVSQGGTISGWAVGWNGTILKLVNNGEAWSPKISGTTRRLYSVYFIPQSDTAAVWAVGQSGTILKSSDGGAKWTTQCSNTTSDLQGAYFANAHTGWAVGDFGVILKRTTARPPSPLIVTSKNALAGSTVEVPIRLFAQGDESAVDFSFNFDPAIFSHPQARRGMDASSATLTADSTQAGSGRLGLSLALPSGQNFAAGAREIVVVTFFVNPNTTADSTRISFGDEPNLRKVADVNGDLLLATWQSGTVTIFRQREVRVVETTAVPGDAVDVVIELISQGNENALGFSLKFDSTILSNPQAKLGKDASVAILNTNASQAGSGRLGLALALPASQSFVAGTREIVVVTFTVDSNTNADSVRIDFVNLPIAREVADITSNLLPAKWTCGNVAISHGFEADVSPRPKGDRSVTIADWVQVGRFVAGLDTVLKNTREFQRADCAPKVSCGDGRIAISDWVQAGRYAAGLDSVVRACGPLSSVSTIATALNTTTMAMTKADAARTVQIVNPNFQPGQTHTVAIAIDARGDENAIGFSLGFDPTVLTFTKAVLGNGANGAALNVNGSHAAMGSIGIALALPAGQAFAAGTRQLVTVNFSANPNAAVASAPIEFKDRVISREVVDVNGNALLATWRSGLTAVEESTNALPASFELGANYPNPFNPSTTITYALPHAVEAKLVIYDMLGQHVRTLVDQTQQAGRYAAIWDGRNEQGQPVASGTFLYQLRARNFVKTLRMALVR
jgi:photosystem II stability/assembly factor-like uncharacterized protein